MMSVCRLVTDETTRRECSDLAMELMDVAQIVQRYVASERAQLAKLDDISDGLCALTYIFDRLEDQSLEVQVELLGGLAGVLPDAGRPPIGTWVNAADEVRRFNQRFELFLFKIRNRFFEGSNREARVAFEAEEAAVAQTNNSAEKHRPDTKRSRRSAA